MDDAQKQCSDCGQTFPLIAFYTHPQTRDGRMARCKSCHKAAGRARYTTNPEFAEQQRQRMREKYQTDPDYRERQIERKRRCRNVTSDSTIGQPHSVIRQQTAG